MWEITNESKVQLYTIQIKNDKDQIDPVICRREKIDGKVILTPIKWLLGKFDRVELSTYHSDVMDKDVENINIYLWDKDGEYKLSTAWTSLGRSLLNSLAWEKELWELKISVYSKGWNDGKIRPRISIYNEWQMTNWLLSVDEQKSLIEPITKKDGSFVSNDYTALDEKLKCEIENINNKKKYVKESEAMDVLEDIIEEDNNDLPF